MLRTTLTIATILAASLASAQTQSSAAAPQPEAPALVLSVAPETTDSPLVQAAKRAVAARQRVTVKIDNASVKNATKLMTTTDTARTIPHFPALPPPSQQKRPASADAAASSKKPDPSKPAMRHPVDDAEQLFTDEEYPPTQAPDPPKPSKKP